MNALVTGASGFIGSAVVRALLGRGYAVRALVEPGAHRRNLEGLDIDIDIVEADIRDRAAIARAMQGADTLFHLAAIYRLWLPRPRVMYEVNVEGTRTVLFAALRAQLQRVVHTSSIAAIGRRSDGAPADESPEFAEWRHSSDYVRSKWLSERMALAFADEGLPVVVVNPSFPFGEGDTAPTPTGRFIVEALRGRIPGYSPGGFNAIAVDDVAEGHVLAAERGRVGERYILGDHDISYRDFYRVVTDVAGLRPITRPLPAPVIRGIAWFAERYARYTHEMPYVTREAAEYSLQRHFYDASKARRELGLPSTPLRQTVERAVAWYRQNGYDAAGALDGIRAGGVR